MKRVLIFGMVMAIGAVLIFTVSTELQPFGTFPERMIGENLENAVGYLILIEAPEKTGATNTVTSVVWGYRGYDTLGEATVLFTAVMGVIAVLRTVGRHG
jgi:multisubunit Na+/H+ antiporter MnhB subunit